jgi:hypothetical protein
VVWGLTPHQIRSLVGCSSDMAMLQQLRTGSSRKQNVRDFCGTLDVAIVASVHFADVPSVSTSFFRKRLEKRPSWVSFRNTAYEGGRDARVARVPAPLPASRPAPRLCPHPLFRVPGQSPSRHPPAPLPAPARRPAHAALTRSLHFLTYPAHLFPLSQMFYSHDHRRKTFCTYYLSINSVETTP